jgi:hypothetical protein
MSVFLGCDPGMGGAFAVLTVNPDGSQTVAVTPTPVVWTQVGKGKRRRYDVAALFDTLRDLPPVTLAYLEQQGARPRQGVSSMVTIGFGEGLWTALLVACRIPFVVVAPLRWRYQVGLRGGDKGAVRLAACRRFPAVPLKIEHADAVMLAVAAALGHGVVHREARPA